MSTIHLRKVTAGLLLALLTLSLPACQSTGGVAHEDRVPGTPHSTGLHMAVFTGWDTAGAGHGTAGPGADTMTADR